MWIVFASVLLAVISKRFLRVALPVSREFGTAVLEFVDQQGEVSVVRVVDPRGTQIGDGTADDVVA